MKRIIAHTRPSVGAREAAAAMRILLSGEINDGMEGCRLATDIATMIGAAGGLVASTGTHALILALRALGVSGPDDRVAIPDLSCRAVYDAVRLAGGTPVFVDIDDTLTMSPESASMGCSHGLKAIILPHLFGQPAHVEAIAALGVPIIEDIAHAPGALIGGRPVGSFSRFAVFSFEGSKYVTAGEGGVVVARDEADLDALSQMKMGGEIAAQCRLSDVISAVARIQWKRLPAFIAMRRRLAVIYRRRLSLSGTGAEFVHEPQSRPSIAYRFPILVDADRRDDLMAVAESKGILLRHPIRSGCLSAYCPGIRAGSLAMAASVDRRIVSLPIYPSLSRSDQDRVIDAVNLFLAR